MNLSYVNSDLCIEIERRVKESAASKENKFTYGHWTNHVKKVVVYAQFLAEKQHGDTEICEIAALLHDIAQYSGNTDSNNIHHIEGAKIAGQILMELNYPEEGIERVKKCILNHRGSVLKPAESIEEQIIKDADAMSHFDTIPSLFKVAFRVLKLTENDAGSWVRDKIERDWTKISDQSKPYISDKYEAVKLLLDS